MKAAITTAYGLSDVLNIEEVAIPTIASDEILVEVKAASINPLDWKIRSGELKMMTGKIAPKILGSDYSGIVSKIGTDINNVKIGNQVFGMVNGMKVKEGSHAEFIRVKENDIWLKPENIEFEEAAAIPLVALTAHKALIEIAQLSKGSYVLINGCTGGVGSVAVQIAKSLGSEVSGICSTNNLEFAKNLGADHVIDYKTENVLEKPISYDVILDTVGNLKYSQSKKILKPAGLYVTTAATIPAMLFGPLLNVFRQKKAKLVMNSPNSKTLSEIKSMVENNQIRGHVSKVFKLEDVREAHDLSERGGFTGKLVLKM
ncbi:MAG: NAD(P)-dependent alcohol dehydrogenase [Candidatus Marinimicrobia bacterium]|nr:NAD(P)-dependent alcohol dehydrogenase [Candidatus Neomarinimicrobiota bacterium]